MAAEAEAAREARAKVIAAEGEKKASQALREAADTISESPAALQLRYLQVRGGQSNTANILLSDAKFNIGGEEFYNNISLPNGPRQPPL